MTTAGDLIEALSELDPDTEIRLMTQPGWPFENAVRAYVWTPGATGRCMVCAGFLTDPEHDIDSRHYDHQPEAPWEPDDAQPGTVAYLVEGHQIGYGAKEAWDR